MTTNIKNIGLAAYAKMNGYKLLEVRRNDFVFDMPSGVENELRIDYANSQCSQHDVEICNLRDMQRLVRGQC